MCHDRPKDTKRAFQISSQRKYQKTYWDASRLRTTKQDVEGGEAESRCAQSVHVMRLKGRITCLRGT